MHDLMSSFARYKNISLIILDNNKPLVGYQSEKGPLKKGGFCTQLLYEPERM